MAQISLRKKVNDTTAVSNNFIDNYMTVANEAQIKIYIYLLRCIGGNLPVSVSSIADRFNYTEKDILRALMYLDRAGLVSIDFDSENNIVGICMNELIQDQTSTPVSEPSSQNKSSTTDDSINAKPFYSMDQMAMFKDKEGVNDLIFITESYLGKTLGIPDLNTLLYMYEELHFPLSLMEYLIEYCVNAGHRSMRYIEKVALSWAQEGITSVEEAKALSNSGKYRKECYAVLRAFGITGRNIVDSDISSVTHWIDDFGFEIDVILEACNRTINAISKPSFSYADSILKRWYESGVHSYSDIKNADDKFKKKTPKAAPKAAVNGTNRFKNFNERNEDFNAIAMELMENQVPLSQ